MRNVRARAGDSAVLVEAAAGLAAEEPGVRHGDETRRRRHPRLAELLPQRLARVHVHVDPHQVDELARPHRPAGAVLHPGVEVGGRHPRLVEHADAVVQERDQDAVDDEAGGVVAADRMLAELLAERVGRLEGLVGGALGADDLHERHQRRRVEEVHADDALGRRDRAGDLRDRERRRVRREDGVGATDAFQLREQLPLGLELLDDRLDHDVAVGEVADLGRRGQQADVEGLELALLDLAREEVLDPATRRLPQLAGHLAARGGETRLDRELRDARAHRPQPYDSDLHAAEPRGIGSLAWR